MSKPARVWAAERFYGRAAIAEAPGVAVGSLKVTNEP
jgi:hypothetical protein